MENKSNVKQVMTEIENLVNCLIEDEKMKEFPIHELILRATIISYEKSLIDAYYKKIPQTIGLAEVTKIYPFDGGKDK